MFPLDPVTRKILDNTQFWGFSFNSGLNRMSDYKLFLGGYSGLTENRSFGRGAGPAEEMIVSYYQRLGYFVAESKINFTKHNGGQGRGLKKY